MSNGQAFRDDNNVPVNPLYDATGHQVVNWQAGTVSTDATTNQKYAAAAVAVQVSSSITPGNAALPVLTSAATGYVAVYASNPATLTANTDAAFKWGAAGTTQVNHVMLQNNTALNVNWDLDVATSVGSPILAPGQTLFLDVQTTAVHVQTNGTPNLNGATAGNVVVRGWL